MSNLIGQSLGRYHILEQLGEGGMAIVYKAYDTRLERDVAVKVIRRGAFPPDHLDQILKRFERESKALAKLFHPNIVKVLDFGNYEGSPFMVLEYSPGGTLKQRLGKPIPWQESIPLLLPLARALEYAHGQGIIHRDVKPSNILLTKTNQPLLTDFGIAKILERGDATTLTGTGVGVGTPEYMAPEQWTGKAGVQSDIYSLGVILYEMVTGRKPYVADTPAAILLKQATEPLPRPTQFVPGLPESVEKVLIKALAKNPEDRFVNMAGFTSAMEKLLKGQDVASLTGFANETMTSQSGTFATVQQEDSRLTRLQESTRDTMSMSRLPSTDRDRTRSDAPAQRKSTLPAWTFGLIAAIGGFLLLIALCVGIAFATGMFDRGAVVIPTESAVTPPPDGPVPTEPSILTEISPTIVSATVTIPPVQQVRPSATEGLKHYFSYISAGNYQKGWGLLTDHFISKNNNTGYQPYADWWSTVDRVSVDSVSVDYETSYEAHLIAELSYYFTNGKVDTYDLMEYFMVYAESVGTWMIDDAALLRGTR